MMVDDDEDHLLLCKLSLQKQGFEVMTLSVCDHLLEKTIVFSPDLIFMDHQMRDISGVQATKMIKENPSTSHIQVIYFSSCDDIVKAANEAGANAFLRKPFELESMLKLINEL